MKWFQILVILLLVPVLVIAQLKGKVVGVSDGDTFTLLTDDKKQYKIRLHGIDCPEKGQDYGQVAKKFTSDNIFNTIVTVEETDIDRYGRTVGIVYLPDNRVLNEKLLKAGLAWHYKKYDQRENWAKMETVAKSKRIGLWKDADAIPPWDYRKNSKKPK